MGWIAELFGQRRVALSDDELAVWHKCLSVARHFWQRTQAVRRGVGRSMVNGNTGKTLRPKNSFLIGHSRQLDSRRQSPRAGNPTCLSQRR
jgi:hypothetical protein